MNTQTGHLSRFFRKTQIITVASALTLVGTACSVEAVITSGWSESTGMYSVLSAPGGINATWGPHGYARINNPSDPDQSDSVQSVSEADAEGTSKMDADQDAGQDAVTVGAVGSLLNGGMNATTAGDALVNNLTIVLRPGNGVTPDFFRLGASTLSSQTDSSGGYGALSSIGDSIIEGLTVSVAGIPISLGAVSAPNSTIGAGVLGITGLTLIFNEQTVVGDGISSTEMTTTALHVILDEVLLEVGSPPVSGEIIIGRTASSLTASPAPEPSSGVLLLLGGVGLLSFRRRRG